MSYGTHKAIGGMDAACARTHARCEEAVSRYCAVQTEADLSELYDWARQQDWFLRSEADEQVMRDADRVARGRIADAKVSAATEHAGRPAALDAQDLASRWPTLPKSARPKALAVHDLMTSGHEQVSQDIRTMLSGNIDGALLELVGGWMDPTRRWNRSVFFMQKSAEWRCHADRRIVSAVFAALAPSQQQELERALNETIAECRDEFFEYYPRFRGADSGRVPAAPVNEVDEVKLSALGEGETDEDAGIGGNRAVRKL